MTRTHQDAKEAEYTRTRGSPFNQCSGRPDWKCYLKIKKHATKVACRLEVDYDWVTNNLGHKFGLMADMYCGGRGTRTSNPLIKTIMTHLWPSRQFIMQPPRPQLTLFKERRELQRETKNYDGGMCADVCTEAFARTLWICSTQHT